MTEQQIAAMRQALEALNEVTGWQWAGPMRVMDEVEDAITALTAALEQPQEKYQYGTPLLVAMTGKAQEALNKKAENARELGLDYEPVQQEPVAWVGEISEEAELMLEKPRFRAVPLYTRPQAPEPVIDKSAAIRIATALGWEPKREPLTDEQIAELWDEAVKYAPSEIRIKDFARAIEAAHGITGEKNGG